MVIFGLLFEVAPVGNAGDQNRAPKTSFFRVTIVNRGSKSWYGGFNKVCALTFSEFFTFSRPFRPQNPSKNAPDTKRPPCQPKHKRLRPARALTRSPGAHISRALTHPVRSPSPEDLSFTSLYQAHSRGTPGAQGSIGHAILPGNTRETVFLRARGAAAPTALPGAFLRAVRSFLGHFRGFSPFSRRPAPAKPVEDHKVWAGHVLQTS